jgi:membrane protease YdiL (CAAX protease family)
VSWARLKDALEGLGGEPTVIVCGASACLVISHYQGAVGFFHALTGGRFSGGPAAATLGHFWWFGTSVFFYLVVPLLLSRLTGGSFHRRYGLGLGDWRAGLALSGLFLALMLPAVVLASRWDSFRGIYPLAGQWAYTVVVEGKQQHSWALFVAYEAGYAAYFVAWEFLFRGWMVNGLLPSWGKAGALLTQVAPFAIMHFGKAEPEALGSIVAGVALGILALRTRSFWYGALVHVVVAVTMDALAVVPVLLGP